MPHDKKVPIDAKEEWQEGVSWAERARRQRARSRTPFEPQSPLDSGLAQTAAAATIADQHHCATPRCDPLRHEDGREPAGHEGPPPPTHSRPSSVSSIGSPKIAYQNPQAEDVVSDGSPSQARNASQHGRHRRPSTASPTKVERAAPLEQQRRRRPPPPQWMRLSLRTLSSAFLMLVLATWALYWLSGLFGRQGSLPPRPRSDVLPVLNQAEAMVSRVSQSLVGPIRGPCYMTSATGEHLESIGEGLEAIRARADYSLDDSALSVATCHSSLGRSLFAAWLTGRDQKEVVAKLANVFHACSNDDVDHLLGYDHIRQLALKNITEGYENAKTSVNADLATCERVIDGLKAAQKSPLFAIVGAFSAGTRFDSANRTVSRLRTASQVTSELKKLFERRLSQRMREGEDACRSLRGIVEQRRGTSDWTSDGLFAYGDEITGLARLCR